MKRWCGGHFDPDWFDLAMTDKDVRNALRPNVRRRQFQPNRSGRLGQYDGHRRGLMPTLRGSDSMLDALLFGTTTSLAGTSPAIELLRAQEDLHTYKLAESVQNASIQLGVIGTAAGRQVAFDAIRMEELSTPLWAESVNQVTRTREGFLIEAEEQGAWAVSTYAENGDSYAMSARVLILKRDSAGSMRVQRGPTTRADRTQLIEIGESVMAVLAIASAPMLTERL